MAAQKQQFPVVHGPSKWDLSIALFDRRSERELIFQANCPTITHFNVLINGVECEDGSGESWIITGYSTPVEDARGTARARQMQNPQHTAFQVRRRRVSIYFRTDSRKGYITFLD